MKKVTIDMSLRTAAAVRQVLYKEQEGYTNNPVCMPERVFEIREVITDIDDALTQATADN
jgi:hypothetical protein